LAAAGSLPSNQVQVPRSSSTRRDYVLEASVNDLGSTLRKPYSLTYPTTEPTLVRNIGSQLGCMFMIGLSTPTPGPYGEPSPVYRHETRFFYHTSSGNGLRQPRLKSSKLAIVPTSILARFRTICTGRMFRLRLVTKRCSQYVSLIRRTQIHVDRVCSRRGSHHGQPQSSDRCSW
jgi:hypothetical protein